MLRRVTEGSFTSALDGSATRAAAEDATLVRFGRGIARAEDDDSIELRTRVESWDSEERVTLLDDRLVAGDGGAI